MRPPVKLAFTSLLASKLLDFNFVIHFTPIMCYTSKAVSVHSLTPLLQRYTITHRPLTLKRFSAMPTRIFLPSFIKIPPKIREISRYAK